MSVSVPETAQGAPLHTVLVGVDDTAPGSGLASLHSSTDVAQLQQLFGQLSEDSVQQTILVNESASRDSILTALSPVNHPAGSHVWLHFSGHGVQLPDESGDEPDGIDEALVPWGASPAHVETLLLDDTLGLQLDRLRAHLGPRGHLTVSLDACHAGGALRGVQSSPGWLDLTHAVELAPLTLLAATDATGVAVERARGDGGALTLALVDGLRRAGAAAHWSTVLDHIRQDGLPDEVHFVGEPTRSVLGGNKVAEVPSRKPHPTVSDPSVGVRLSLVSVDPTQDCAATGPQDTVLPLGTHYGLVVQHLGDTPAWVDLVHRDAHGGETPLWPPAPGLDEPLSPGATWRVPLCLTATAPVGPEELVVRARSRSGTALDLRGVRVVEVPTLVSEDRVDIQVVARPDR